MLGGGAAVTADAAWRAIPGSTWRDRAPMTLRSMDGPDGLAMPTSIDRRWLHRVESFLAVSGNTRALDDFRRDLLEYLRESCQHVWSNYPADGPDDPIASHRQCVWCNDVEWGEF